MKAGHWWREGTKSDSPQLAAGTAWLSGGMPRGLRRRIGTRETVPVLDEIHKIPGWAGPVRRLWHEDEPSAVSLRLLFSRSTTLLTSRCLTASLVPGVQSGCTPSEARADSECRGRLVVGGRRSVVAASRRKRSCRDRCRAG